jgi:hypothetical protein
VTLTVGRCQLGNSVDISTLSRSGNQVTLAGTFFPTVDGDTAQSDAVRQQLNGMLGNADEMAFPVTFTVDPRIDGFYQVTGADISERPSSPTTGAFGYSLQLQRIGGGFGNPTFEVSCTNVTRTNAHGLGGSALVVVPGDGSSLTYDITGFDGVASFATRPTADGIGVYLLGAGNPNGRAYRFDVSPADYYKATCSIEILFGSTWFPVVGRQIPRTFRWRISNGLIRFTSGTAGAHGTMEIWNGSAWASWNIAYTDGTVRKIGRTAPGATTERDIPVTILRNSPEQVVIRQQAFDGVTTWTLARGNRHATISWSVATNTTGPASFGVGLSGAGTAGTADTGSVYSNTGVSGTQAMFAVTGPVLTPSDTRDTTNTRIRNATAALSGTAFAGGQASPIDPTGPNSLFGLLGQMMAGLNCRQRVIAR